MKKAAIAGLVVALGAIWTGTAWYTGQKAEAFVKQSIEDGNVELRKIGEKWGVTPVIELMSFERGVFSSTERYRVKFTLPAKDGKPAVRLASLPIIGPSTKPGLIVAISIPAASGPAMNSHAARSASVFDRS